MQALLVGACASLPAVAAAQNIVSVPFTNGFIGTRSSSAGNSNNVLTFGTLGIARVFFVQNSSTNAFELQGNDIPGTMRIVRTDGTTLNFPASVNWRNSGGSTYLVGILPRPASPYTFTYSGGSIQITDGTVSGGSSVGGYVAAYTGTTLTDGGSTSGNAALGQVLDGLNQYLATVVSSRPQGPVTVNALNTSSSTPTLTGSVTLAAGEQFTVTVNNVQYGTATTPAVSVGGGGWSLTLTSPIANGTYEVIATVTNADGFTLSDATTNELRIASTLTLSGSFAANDKTYDGTTLATGTTTGLSLQGVFNGHTVTIASVTLGFQTAAAGVGRTVTIAAVTLGGNDAGGYSLDLTGAPTASADITTRPLTISGLAAVSRSYDGTTNATLGGTATYANLATGEAFSVSGEPSAQFATSTVGSDKAVTVTGFSAPSVNYTLTQPTLSAHITPRALTIGGSFTADNKTFDGSTAATIASNSLRLTGVIADDHVSLTQLVAQFASSEVGTGQTVSITAASLTGGDAHNYILSLVGAPTTTAAISCADPTVVTVSGTFTANSRVYDATTIATGSVSGLTLQGILPGDDVHIGSVSFSFADAAVGENKPVQIASITLAGAQAASYNVSLIDAPGAIASITPRALAITGLTVEAKVYDGTSGASLTGTPGYVGLVSSDVFTVTGTPSAAFPSAAVGNSRAVTVIGFEAPSANYIIAQPAGLTGSILPRVITVGGSFSVQNKVFDGTTSAQLVAQSLVPLNAVSGEPLVISNVSVAFTTASVGTGKPVIITNADIAGSTAGNYTLSLENAPQTTAAISPATTSGGGSGSPPPSLPPGQTQATSGGQAVSVTTTIVQDTTVRVAGSDFALSLIAVDEAGSPVPIDAPVVLQLEHGGRVHTSGSGFAPGTLVTLYLYGATGEAVLLGRVTVHADGTFSYTANVPALPEGDYTLQLNGSNNGGTLRSVAMGVQVTAPPPDLVLTAVPSTTTPTAGDTLTITITVINNGTGPAIDVVIPRAFREAGFDMVAAVPQHGTYDADSQLWLIPRIEAGASARLLLTAIVQPPAPEVRQ